MLSKIVSLLEEISLKYPPELVAAQRRDIRRVAFHIQLAISVAPSNRLDELTICDLGGGIGLFSVGCAAIGFRKVILVDDFGDRVNLMHGNQVLDLHESYGVHVVSRDIVSVGMDDLPGKLDVVTSFDSMEHWHNSPKGLFHQVMDRLRDGGGFVLCVPNNVNLRKRITVPLGRGQWSSMADWYEAERFRGHVREPNVADLNYIARDMNLHNVKILGRNWLGLGAQSSLMRGVTRLADRPLRLFPTLCSDIYLCGKKHDDGDGRT